LALSEGWPVLAVVIAVVWWRRSLLPGVIVGVVAIALFRLA
jgi:uncharacterized membrane protein